MILTSDLQADLQFLVDDENSDRYNFANDYMPAINLAVRYIMSAFDKAFERGSLSPTVFGELLFGEKITPTSITGLDASKLVVTVTTMWRLVGIDPAPIFETNDYIGPTRSLATYLPFDMAGNVEEDPFEAGAAQPTDIAQYSFTNINIVNPSGEGDVKQIDAVIVTGSSGTATIGAAGGLTKTLTWNASLTQTCADFVTANAAAYLAVDIVLTSSTDMLIFTSEIAGDEFVHPTITPATGDLDGTVANIQSSSTSARNLIVRPALVGDCAIVYLMNPTKVIASTTNIEFPNVLYQPLLMKAYQYMLFQAGKQPMQNIQASDKDVQELVALFI